MTYGAPTTYGYGGYGGAPTYGGYGTTYAAPTYGTTYAAPTTYAQPTSTYTVGQYERVEQIQIQVPQFQQVVHQHQIQESVVEVPQLQTVEKVVQVPKLV